MSAFPGDFAAAETGVFWDIEDCKIGDLNAGMVLQNIRSTIARAGHHGPVSVRAYGDMTGHDFPSMRELSSITSPQERDTPDIPRFSKTSFPGQLNILNRQI